MFFAVFLDHGLRRIYALECGHRHPAHVTDRATLPFLPCLRHQLILSTILHPDTVIAHAGVLQDYDYNADSLAAHASLNQLVHNVIIDCGAYQLEPLLLQTTRKRRVIQKEAKLLITGIATIGSIRISMLGVDKKRWAIQKEKGL